MLDKLNPAAPSHAGAICLAQKMRDDQLRQIEAVAKGCLSEIIALLKLYRTDPFYRQNGLKYFLGQVLLVCFRKRTIKQQCVRFRKQKSLWHSKADGDDVPLTTAIKISFLL